MSDAPRGWIPLWRTAPRSRVWRDGTATDWKVWCWLLLQAHTAPGATPVGCVDTSTRKIAEGTGVRRETVSAALTRLEEKFRSIRVTRVGGKFGPARIEIRNFGRYRTRGALLDAKAEPEQIALLESGQGGPKSGSRKTVQGGPETGCPKTGHPAEKPLSPDPASAWPENRTVSNEGKDIGTATTGGVARGVRLWDRLNSHRERVGMQPRNPVPGEAACAQRLLTEGWEMGDLERALDGLGAQAARDPKAARWLDGVNTWSPEVLRRGLAYLDRAPAEDEPKFASRFTEL